MKKVLLLAVVVLALGASEVQARFVQGASLRATGTVQTWESKLLPPNRPTEVHIYRRGEEVAQRWINGCSAHYVAGGLVVRVEITEGCGGSKPGTYTLRYVSVAGRQPFRVELTG